MRTHQVSSNDYLLSPYAGEGRPPLQIEYPADPFSMPPTMVRKGRLRSPAKRWVAVNLWRPTESSTLA